MQKPIRHSTHILETESSKFFNNCIPNDWYVDKPNHDYGLDYNVNIVINNQVTGFNFSVQLKSTGKEKNKDSASITINHSTLSLYNTRLEPVFLVIYVQDEKEAYWYWYNELKIDLTSSQKSFKINIPKTNKLSLINWEEVIKYVRDIFSIKLLIDGIKHLEYGELSNSEILAWRYYYSLDYENAIFYFKNLIREKPNNPVILEGLAYCQYMTYSYKEALYNINRAIDLSKDSRLQLTKACILAEDGIQSGINGKIIEAKNIFRRFIGDNPNLDTYHYNYANTLSRLGETDEAIKHYTICLSLNPNNAKAWKNLGQVYYDIKEHAEELLCYEKALSIEPDMPQALFSKGVTLSHIFNQDKEGLSLMMKSLEIEDEMLQNYPAGYFWLAYANEKLNILDDSLKWINKGLNHNPEDRYCLNFKSNFLIEHWPKADWLKDEAIRFFAFRLELENDYKSLYSLIKIQNITNEQEIYELIRNHTHLLKNANLLTLKKCGIDIHNCIIFLLYYDRYLEVRHICPINRYIDHVISDLYVISSEFLEILDLMFAVGYSKAISEYLKNKDQEQLIKTILDELILTPQAIFELIPEENFSEEDSISIMAHIFLEFPKIVFREFGTQIGYISGLMGLDKPDPIESMTETWVNNLKEQILLATNKRLRLMKE
jgi:tetratricopeptide (TPR) repeat protein